MSRPKQYLSNSDITLGVAIMARKINEMDWDYERIIAVSRGGLGPAMELAHRLNTKKISVIVASSYDHQDQSDEVTLELPDIPKDGKYIIVDDLCDSGKTIDALKKIYVNSKTATVFWKQLASAVTVPDIYGTECDGEAWLVFPWEDDHPGFIEATEAASKMDL